MMSRAAPYAGGTAYTRVNVKQRVSSDHQKAAAGGWRITVALAFVLIAAAGVPATSWASVPSVISVVWDANPEPEVTGYRIYIGTEPGVYEQKYDVGLSTTFRYIAAAGRQYYFAVAAYSDNATSPLSAEVSAFADPFFEVFASAGADAPCAHCADRLFRAEGLGPVSAVTPAADGRLFFIEDGRHVRIAAAAPGATAARALSTRDGVEITGLALAPDFERSRFVFLAVAEQRPDGTRNLRIVRYREVQGQLGEAAVLVDGLRLWSDRNAAFTVGRGGRIFVALPIDGRAHRDPYAGYVLWFEGDGRLPQESRGGSPVLAHSFAEPVALVADGDDLWLAGADAAWYRSLARLTPQLPAGAEWPLVPSGVPSGRPADRLSEPAQAFAARSVDGSASGVAVVLDSAGRIQPLITSGRAPTEQLQVVEWFVSEVPVSVAIGLRNEVLIAFRRADGTFAIEEIAPR
jgi:hypothetical protein